jgi:hypothetical protein
LVNGLRHSRRVKPVKQNASARAAVPRIIRCEVKLSASRANAANSRA